MTPPSLLSRLGVLLAYAGVAVVALLLSECFLNPIISPTIAKSLWYTDGIHTANSKFGFVFTPGYHGWMRHPDKVFLARLELDPYGFRLPANTPGSKQNVLALGGRSMVFSYGAPDDLTVHRAIDASLQIPSTVYDASWPGFDVFRIFHVYRDGLGKTLRPDFVVASFYQDTIDSFAYLPADFSRFNGPVSTRQEYFPYFEKIAIARPTGAISQAVGPLYFQSIVVNKWAARLDRIADQIRGAAGQPPAPAGIDQARMKLGAQRFTQFTAYLQSYFGGKSKVLFVFLPGIAIGGQDMTPDYYDKLVAALPPGTNYLDANREYGSKVRANGYIAAGHYPAESTALLGKAIATRINEIQGSANADARLVAASAPACRPPDFPCHP